MDEIWAMEGGRNILHEHGSSPAEGEPDHRGSDDLKGGSYGNQFKDLLRIQSYPR